MAEYCAFYDVQHYPESVVPETMQGIVSTVPYYCQQSSVVETMHRIVSTPYRPCSNLLPAATRRRRDDPVDRLYREFVSGEQTWIERWPRFTV